MLKQDRRREKARLNPASSSDETTESPHIPAGPKKDYSLKEGQTFSIRCVVTHCSEPCLISSLVVSQANLRTNRLQAHPSQQISLGPVRRALHRVAEVYLCYHPHQVLGRSNVPGRCSLSLPMYYSPFVLETAKILLPKATLI
jgi:hypothetical protein